DTRALSRRVAGNERTAGKVTILLRAAMTRNPHAPQGRLSERGMILSLARDARRSEAGVAGRLVVEVDAVLDAVREAQERTVEDQNRSGNRESNQPGEHRVLDQVLTALLARSLD